ncbi:MAG: metal ABC transporter permease [Deltaproteobacteria bacterium]|nr:metal ABC transporter permease [Deltaproteobacteria bacterium]
MSFWDARFLWQEPMLAAVLGAALCGYLGFFVVLRRIAFMSAALSQVSGLGVAMAFWVGSFAEVTPHQEGTPWYASPALYAILFAVLGAVTMALPSRSKRVSPESIVALAYLASSAGVIMVLNSPRIAQEAHEIGDLLFGNAVVVKHEHLVQLGIVAAGVLLLHAVLFKDFLFCSFDPETARAAGYPVRNLDLVLHLSLALTVAVTTRALGALPVFAFLVLPAGAALLLSERLRPVIWIGVFLAIVSAGLGYYLSWTFSLPTGPMMVALASAFWIVAGGKRAIEKLGVRG